MKDVLTRLAQAELDSSTHRVAMYSAVVTPGHVLYLPPAFVVAV